MLHLGSVRVAVDCVCMYRTYVCMYVHVWHSFILDISIALQVHKYSEALPTTALILCRS